MGRPSLKDKRRSEILDAVETCVIRYGVRGVTLEQVAEEAGLARALIRHNVGNKDEVLGAFVDRFLEAQTLEIEQTVNDLPEDDRVETLVDWLFDEAYVDPKALAVFEALMVAAPGDPQLAKGLRDWVTAFIDAVEEEVAKAYPEADTDAVLSVAVGLAGIYFNVDSLTALGSMPGLRRASKNATFRLLSTLED